MLVTRDLQEANPGYSLERLMLKLSYFGHLMRRVDLLEKTLMLGGIGGRRRRRRQRMRWAWVWVNSGSWWWTGRPGVLQFIGSQRVRHDWATELNWTEPCISSRSNGSEFAHSVFTATLQTITTMNRASQVVPVVKNPPANVGDISDAGSTPGLGRSPRGWQPTPVFLHGESHGQKSLAGLQSTES